MRPTSGHATRLAASLTVWLMVAPGRSGHKGPDRLPVLPAPVLHITSVGRDPVALAVDERASRIFVLGSAGSVTTLDATTGVVIRTVAVGRGTQSVVVDEATGRAFVTDPGRVFMLDAHTGAVLRVISVGGGGPTGGLAVDARHGEVFVAANGVNRGPAGFGPATIAVLDATTGRLTRSIPRYADLLTVDGAARRIILPYSCDDTPGVADLCVDTLDAATGRRLKTADLSSQQGYEQQPSAVAVDARVGSAVVLYGDGRGDANIAVVATHTGVRRAPVAGAGGSFGMIAVDERANRVAVVTTPDNYAIPTSYRPPPAAWVSMLDARNGQIVGVDSLSNVPNGGSSPVGVAVDARTRHFYVVATPYDTARMQPSHTILGVLDARSGHFLRRLTLSHAAVPSDSLGVPMAVDEQTGRLFITNRRDNTVSVLDTTRL